MKKFKDRIGTCPICETNKVVLKPVQGKKHVHHICADCILKRNDILEGDE